MSINKTSFFKLFLCSMFLFSIGICQAMEPSLNLETLPLRRSKQYPLAPYKKVVVYSTPRTGSSVTYNVLRFLFQNPEGLSYSHPQHDPKCTVWKAHNKTLIETLTGENILYIVPIRNPLDASISTCRIQTKPIENPQDWCKKKIDRQLKQLQHAEALQAAGKHVIFIKYEDFAENLDYLIDVIEEYFHFTIEESDKELIRIGYAKENVASQIDRLSDFRELLPLSGFHGNHVSTTKYTPPPLVRYWLNYYLERIKPFYKKYGYFVES